MSKSYEEMATELTIAWVKAAGDASVAGKLNGDEWLQKDNVAEAYKVFLKALYDGLSQTQSE